MKKHMDYPLSASELAAELGISLSTLERHCHGHFGNPPMKVYLELRLQAARNFLFYQDYNIKDVALAYGFSSSSVFSRRSNRTSGKHQRHVARIYATSRPLLNRPRTGHPF